MKKSKKYQGQAIDRMGTLSTRCTKWYATYEEAHIAASKLAKKWFSSGRVRIDVIDNSEEA